MGNKPGYEKTSDSIPNIVTMEEYTTESHHKDPESKSPLTTWDHVKDKGLYMKQIQGKDTRLGCIPTWPRTIYFLASDIPHSFWEVFNIWTWSSKSFLNHYACDKCCHRLGEILRRKEYKVIRLSLFLKMRKYTGTYCH